MREIKTYDPDQRRNLEDNLYCPYCGNTNQWMIDIRLKHNLLRTQEGYVVELDETMTNRILEQIARNLSRMLDRSIEREHPIFHCANCGNAELDRYGLMIEACWNLGCPGCFHCGQYISENELRDACLECIQSNSGDVDQDFCFSSCPHYDYGLEEVRAHYSITLEELISEAGYGDG